MTAVLERFRAKSPEEQARRRFGLWALAALIVILPLWWFWGAPLAAAALRPLAGLVLGLFSLTGEIRIQDDGAWIVGTELTKGGRPTTFAISAEVIRRLMLGVPLFAAFMIAPPRTGRPIRAALIGLAVLALLFCFGLAGVVWGELAPQLNPSLAGAGMAPAGGYDQPALHPFVAQIALLARYMGLSVAPLIAAVILWGFLNPKGLETLVAEIR